MIKIVLIITGFFLVLFQQFVCPIPTNVQYSFFLIGIILLGVPHGAADLLIATQNAKYNNNLFSSSRFLVNYLSRLFLFGGILWLFPLAGNFLFILFAAYHFGETDLNYFNTNSVTGKFFVISYGLVILSVILLNHFEEIQPIFLLFAAGIKYTDVLNFISLHRFSIMSFIGLFFFINSFIYFLINKPNKNVQEHFLIHFALIILILYNLPMILGFTFYFVVWHSFLSLKNIINYLRKDGTFTNAIITKQILGYSALAIVGISLFGFAGFMFININALMGYIFLGLAVLTAPHMQVMYNMYHTIRIQKKATK